MQGSNNGRGPSGNGRNVKGQWLAGGASPNPRGRPRNKKMVPPKSIAEACADEMATLISVPGESGRPEMMPAYKAAFRKLARSIPDMKLNELITTVRLMERLRVIEAIYERAGGSAQELTREQVLERVKAHLAEIKRTQSGYPE